MNTQTQTNRRILGRHAWLVAVAAVVGLGAPQAYSAAFYDQFETYTIGSPASPDWQAGGVDGGTVSAGSQSTLTPPPVGTRGLQLSGQTARRTANQDFSPGGQYTLQFDAMVSYGPVSGTGNQLLFARWGASDDLFLTLDFNGSAYDLKYFNGGSFVDTGTDVALGAWNRYRLDWSTNSTSQALYVNGALAVQTSLIYSGNNLPDDSSLFVQFLSTGGGDSQTLNYDNVLFTTIPEPSVAGLALLGLGIVGWRRFVRHGN